MVDIGDASAAAMGRWFQGWTVPGPTESSFSSLVTPEKKSSRKTSVAFDLKTRPTADPPLPAVGGRDQIDAPVSAAAANMVCELSSSIVIVLDTVCHAAKASSAVDCASLVGLIADDVQCAGSVLLSKAFDMALASGLGDMMREDDSGSSGSNIVDDEQQCADGSPLSTHTTQSLFAELATLRAELAAMRASIEMFNIRHISSVSEIPPVSPPSRRFSSKRYSSISGEDQHARPKPTSRRRLSSLLSCGASSNPCLHV
jgi:hypothetical protein